MKTNVTYVDATKFEQLIDNGVELYGLIVTAQKGFVKVAGAKGNQVYVASTKRVGRVDISGFEVPFGVEPAQGVFGQVRQQLDFSKPEDKILEDFANLLVALSEQTAKERKAPVRKPKADAPKGWSEKASRKALIAARAQQMAV
jgi:hypothetical protein